MRARITSDWTSELGDMTPEARDVYFMPAYAALHPADGAPAAVVVEDGAHRLIVPGLRAEIPDGRPGQSDLQTPNGYGGPLVSPGAPASFVEQAWAEWRRACAAEGIVAAFFRLHPVLGNRAWLPEGAKVALDRRTVYVDLSRGLEATWKGAESRHRNMVNRARREGTQARWNEPEDWAAFETLYGSAMTRLNAPARLHFDSAYFAGLRALPGTELVCTRDDAGLVAGQIFLWGEAWGHYHLAARREDSPNFTMSLLMHVGLERAAERALRGLHLGGGASTAPDDRVLKFKQSLGGEALDFEVALVVADAGGFDARVAEWTAREGRAPSWLLGYRQPPPGRGQGA